MSQPTPVEVADHHQNIRIRRLAQLDHYASEMTAGLTVAEMRHLAAKIQQDADDLQHGEQPGGKLQAKCDQAEYGKETRR